MQVQAKQLIITPLHLELFELSKGCFTVYALVCLRSGLMYVGQTTTSRFTKRIIEHRTTLKRNIHTNKLLQDVYNKSTVVAYKIASTDNKELCNSVETFCIIHSREGLGLGLNIKDNKRGLDMLVRDVELRKKEKLRTNKKQLQKLSKHVKKAT